MTTKASQTSKPGLPLISDRDAAALLGMSRSTVRRLRRDGQLPFVTIRGAVRIRPEDVAAFVAEQTGVTA